MQPKGSRIAMGSRIRGYQQHEVEEKPGVRHAQNRKVARRTIAPQWRSDAKVLSIEPMLERTAPRQIFRRPAERAWRSGR